MQTEYVLKLTKLCNLRCHYCYEYADLGDPRFMSREQLRAVFVHAAEWHAARGESQHINFVFHGGEPLIRGPRYLDAVFEELEGAFAGTGIQPKTFVQTNLFQLDEAMIERLRRFDGVGVSLDPLSAQRVDRAGRDSTARVLDNIRALRAAGRPIGAITVLSRRVLGRMDELFDYFACEELPFRVLPLSRPSLPGQHDAFGLSAREVLGALCQLFDLWLASECMIPVDPVIPTLEAALAIRRGDPIADFYDRRDHERVLVVNTDGRVFSNADVHLADPWWGNLFEQPLDAILSSPVRLASLEAAERRMANSCVSCPFFGACSGAPMADEHNDFPDALGAWGGPTCVVQRGLLQHALRRVDQLGLARPSDSSRGASPAETTSQAPLFS